MRNLLNEQESAGASLTDAPKNPEGDNADEKAKTTEQDNAETLKEEPSAEVPV